MFRPISELDASEVEFIVKENMKSSNKLLTSFNANSLASGVAQKFREDVVSMNKNIPIVEVVSRPGLRERHWDDIKDTLQMESFNS